MRSLFCALLAIGFLCGAEVSISQSDFVDRAINFVIFFAIVWYLGAEKIKGIFLQRKEGIIQSFNALQEREKAIKKEKEKAEALVLDAKHQANEMISHAKREAFTIAQSFDSRLKQDIQLLSDSFDSLLEQERRKVLQEEIGKIIDQSLQGVEISQDAYIQILSQGVR